MQALKTLKQCAACLEYQQTGTHEQMIPYLMPCRSWEVGGVDIPSINKDTLLCIVDRYSNFPIVKKSDGLSANDLIRGA